MRGRLALPIALVALLLSALPGYAGTTAKLAGKAELGSPEGGPSGEAFIRRLNGHSHVIMRATGLAPGSQLVWRIHTNDTCSAPGPALVTSSPVTVNQVGSALSVLAEAPEVLVGTVTPTFIAIRLYESPNGPELACGRVFDLPFSITNSAHWW